VTTLDFVRTSLPQPPARVLEVGCGQTGELASALAVAGFDVVAIDPMAPPGDIFRRLLLDDLDPSDGPFDGIVAVRSLHHIRDLDAAVGRLAALLGRDGVLVVEEFAWDLADDPTLDWFLEQLRAAGAKAPESLEALRRDWQSEHLGLHGDEALLAALGSRFETRSLERVPGLYRELGGAAAYALESALIEAGTIQAVGFRWVGTLAG
jgi:2-polyprenyl-3-methyl-5-hydroxy-6-metoxy-1,4-benzoquinol methylase